MPGPGQIRPVPELGLANVPVPELGRCQLGAQHIYHLVVYLPYVLADYFVSMYINMPYTSSFRVCGKRDDKVNIYLHNYCLLYTSDAADD